MAEPSNIRINPFTGTGGATNYVELTEKHIVPANSPYVIRLNEVPEKQDPSNIKMVYVDSATGAATSTTLTEVAATPEQGQFRMDYTTNAMDDKTWNTGLVEFSAADAGKIVQVTYTGTGTLAGVNSNHWPSWYTDRGDGSDGDFVPAEDITISGVKNYKSVFIKAGLTITCSSNTWIKCQGMFINHGSISVTPCGGKGGRGITIGYEADADQLRTYGSGTNGDSGICSYGGAGSGIDPGAGGNYIGMLSPVNSYGAGGGAGGIGEDNSNRYTWIGGKGGDGGGSIIITAKYINNTGSISALGGNGESKNTSRGGGGGGGGGGGTIALACDIFANKGTTLVTGGIGGNGRGGKAADGSTGIVLTKEIGVV